MIKITEHDTETVDLKLQSKAGENQTETELALTSLEVTQDSLDTDKLTAEDIEHRFSRSENHTLRFGNMKPLFPFIDKSGKLSHRVYLGPDCSPRFTRVSRFVPVPIRPRIVLRLHLLPLHRRLVRELDDFGVLRAAGSADNSLPLRPRPRRQAADRVRVAPHGDSGQVASGDQKVLLQRVRHHKVDGRRALFGLWRLHRRPRPPLPLDFEVYRSWQPQVLQRLRRTHTLLHHRHGRGHRFGSLGKSCITSKPQTPRPGAYLL